MDAGNNIGPVGVASLVAALEKMPRLTSLEIACAAMDPGNSIGPEGAASLVPALEKMPRLTYLEISSARIGLGLEREGLWLFGVF
jgi:hypothetical protein